MKCLFQSVWCLLLSINCVAGETNSQVLDKVWSIGKAESCSPEMRASFDDSTLAMIRSQMASETDRSALSRVLNPFLFSLGYSHTQFFTEADESYYLLKAYYSETNSSAPSAPLITNPGVQVGSDDHGYFAKYVLDGFPAQAAGLIKGDRILTVNGAPFSGSWGHRAEDSIVRIVHLGQIKNLHMPLPELNWSQALQDATLNSLRFFSYKGRKIGYVRLWSGVHPESASAVWTAVKRFKAANVHGAILDLRGGFGGALWPHLDPFFPDRKSYFTMSATDGDNVTTVMRADPQINPDAFLGPLVVLIDEGSRSGKEALAFQFKKSKRATLIGSSTAGYFSGGGLFLIDQPSDYLLYLCVRRNSKLDGVDIEGIGINPDLPIPFDPRNKLRDSQLHFALELLTRRK